MSVIPVRNLIYVIPLEDRAQVTAHIYAPEQAKQRLDQGIVKYRGPDTKDVRVGDHVFFSGYSGTRVSIEGEGTLVVMEEEFVEAIINDEEPLQFFSQTDILKFIDRAIDTETLRRGADVEKLKDIQSRIHDYVKTDFINRGLLF